jgi:hypothetical protein
VVRAEGFPAFRRAIKEVSVKYTRVAKRFWPRRVRRDLDNNSFETSFHKVVASSGDCELISGKRQWQIS